MWYIYIYICVCVCVFVLSEFHIKTIHRKLCWTNIRYIDLNNKQNMIFSIQAEKTNLHRTELKRLQGRLPLCVAWFISSLTSLIARFMGPTWGPSGTDRTQVGPMLAHGLCSLGRDDDKVLKLGIHGVVLLDIIYGICFNINPIGLVIGVTRWRRGGEGDAEMQ